MNQYHKIHGLYKRYTEGEKKGKFIIGEYSRPEFELLKDINWVWTEKVDGTNIRVQIYNNHQIGSGIWYKGKTDKAEIPKHLLEYLQIILTWDKIKKVFELTDENPDICLYGEGYGYKIQKGGCNYFGGEKNVGFILFDIRIGNMWLKREDVGEIAMKLDIPFVPLVGRGTIDEAIKYIKSKPKSWLGNNDFVMEGIVIKPKEELLDRRGHRILTKIKVKDFKEE